jgi:hypothetical protein
MTQASSSVEPPRLGRVPLITARKLATGLASTTGLGGLTALIFTLVRIGAQHPVPRGLWVALIILISLTCVVSVCALFLDFWVKKLEIQSRDKEAAAALELQKARLDLEKARMEGYLGMLEKLAGDPGQAEASIDLIKADAFHLSVENGTHPASQE